jgi:HTH-type transcriptional regulator/antitoxin HigA
MDVKPIRTERDYRRALKSIERLWHAKKGSPAADELDVLATLVEAYERQRDEIPLPDPIAAIRFRMEQLQLTRKDLEPYIGTRARVAEILNGNRPLTLAMVRRLHKGLGIPAQSLIAEAPEAAA